MKRITDWTVAGPLQFFVSIVVGTFVIRMAIRGAFEPEKEITSVIIGCLAFSVMYTLLYWRFQGFTKKA